MNPLHLSPLPILRAEDQSDSLMFERQGFVDEAAVSALMSGEIFHTRQPAFHEDLALAADDLDFAGWRFSQPLAFPPVAKPENADSTIRRPAPPVIQEPGLGMPHSGSHRWWLAGLAGALSTMLFSLLLLNLSTRPGTHLEVFFNPAKPTVPSAPAQKSVTPEVTAEWTNLPYLRP
jgi:hypothetical protein